MTISELLDQYEPQLAAAFQRAIDEITSQAQIGQIVEALERGDINRAIEAVYLDQAAFQEFERVLQGAYVAGGNETLNELSLRDPQGKRFVVRFDLRALAAENWLRTYSSELVTNIVSEQRTVIRNTLTNGLAAGDNPRTTALNVVGRINKRTGRREGGVIGLSEPMERAAQNARQALNEGRYGDYLALTRRDARFDALIARAKRYGKPLSQAQIDKIIGRYRDRLLKLRGDTIARTETLASLHAAQFESLNQLVATGKVKSNQVKLVWDATRDTRTRIAHMIADKQTITLGETFTVGGKSMRYPGDPNGGPENVINCRCALRPRIDYFTNLR